VSVGFDVPTLHGSLVRLEPLSVRHASDLAVAAEEDRSAYGFTWVPHGSEIDEYLGSQFEGAATGKLAPFAQIRLTDERAVGCTAYWDPRVWPGRSEICAVEIGFTWLGASAQGTGSTWSPSSSCSGMPSNRGEFPRGTTARSLQHELTGEREFRAEVTVMSGDHERTGPRREGGDEHVERCQVEVVSWLGAAGSSRGAGRARRARRRCAPRGTALLPSALPDRRRARRRPWRCEYPTRDQRAEITGCAGRCCAVDPGGGFIKQPRALRAEVIVVARASRSSRG